MKLFGWVRRGSEVSPEQPRAMGQTVTVGPNIDTSKDLDGFLRSGSETSSGAVVTPETGMAVAASNRCVTLIAGAVATMPLAAIRREGDFRRELDPTDPLNILLRRRPNSWQSPSQFRRMLQAHMLLRGNGYALKVRSRGQITELVPMMPDKVQPKQMPDGSIVYRYQREGGAQIVLPQSEVMHLRGLSLDGVNGLSVLHYARESIGMALQTEKHGANLFKNGASPGAVLEHPDKIGPEGQAFLKASLEDYRGAENAHKTLILEEGMHWKAMTMTSADAQFVENRKFTRSEIAMFFGVPPHMLGDTERSTSWGTGIEQQSIGFVTYTLQDWLTEWEETINRDLISDPSVSAKFNVNGLVRGDINARWEAYVKALQWGVYSPNEVRALEDMNPRDDGQGGQYYDPPNTAGGQNEPAEPT